MLQIRFDPKRRSYTGAELRPHFLLTEMKMRGHALGAFIGDCRVETEALVDWEDRIVNDFIEAKEMVHFIGEFFGCSLKEGVLFQRLMVATAQEIIQEKLSKKGSLRVHRDGDDLFVGKKKLSVSIVTASPVSVLLHLGININPKGAPVAAIGLRDLGIPPQNFIGKILKRLQTEWESMDWACAKVRPVTE